MWKTMQKIVSFLMMWSLLFQLPGGRVQAAPNALKQPDNVACRPHEGRTDQLRIEWLDTNDGAADYRVYRKEVGAANWGDPGKPTTDGTAGDTGSVVDDKADGDPDTNVVYHYRVTAFDNDEETLPGADQTCREPQFLVSNPDGNPNTDDGVYRMYYRLSECPEYDGKTACTENINKVVKNKHVAQMLQTSEDYRAAFMDLGFNDPGSFGDLDKFPLDMFPCNNGCANGDGVQYPPENFEGADDYVPATGDGRRLRGFYRGSRNLSQSAGRTWRWQSRPLLQVADRRPSTRDRRQSLHL